MTKDFDIEDSLNSKEDSNKEIKENKEKKSSNKKIYNEKLKNFIEKLKVPVLKKYKFIESISILPPESIKFFLESEEVPKESANHLHLCFIVPDENIKEINEMKEYLIKKIQESKEKIWINIKTPEEIWGTALDGQYNLVSAIAMSFPLYDEGFLGSLRVAEIHKSLVLSKFKEYVVSYVIAGSLVRGDTTKTSDVDVFIIINDTDVKRMSPLELKERLRNIIFQYISEATSLAGVDPNILNVQPYLLTEFWEAVKDANPVMFTFIRDGVPLYDKGTFMPWKALLKMGKLKPSPEAIDMFMSAGDQTVKRVKRTLLDIVIHEMYWGILTPSQAILMLYGLPPPTPKQVVSEMKRVFVGKEKMLEAKYVRKNQGLVVFSLYTLGILIAVLSAKLFKSIIPILKGPVSPLVMELPPYRIPTAWGVIIHMWERSSLFLKKAGTVIFAGVIVIWFLASFPLSVEYAGEASLVGQLGKFLAPVFKPAGFPFWQAAVALFFGIIAKEIVVGTFGTLFGGEGKLAAVIPVYFSQLSAYSFMVMSLLYIPCIASIGVIYRETNSWKWTVFSVFYSIFTGYLSAVLIYQIGSLI